MAGNTFGRLFRLTTFGESHGPAIGAVLDGCPAGLEISEAEIQADLDLRKPGGASSSTARKEADKVSILSGIFEGRTTGAPIGFLIRNEDQRSRDYGDLADCFRPGHADWSHHCKYGGHRDYRGGGRSSGRETAMRVAGGAVAKKLLCRACGARILAAAVELGGVGATAGNLDLEGAARRPFFAASDALASQWEGVVADARSAADTIGGIIRVEAHGVPAGLGEPVFDKLDARLAYALMGIGAVKGVEIGQGFRAAGMRGSENNDPMLPGENGPRFASNNAGGILGGVSTGQPIVIQIAVKPIASIPRPQDTVDHAGKPRRITIGGRHDLAAIPRAVPVAAAMTALALADALLLQARMAAIP